MLALRLPPEIEKRLDALAKKTGRTKSFYAREAILRHVEDLEDYHLAQRRLARGGERVTLEQLEKELAAAARENQRRIRSGAHSSQKARRARDDGPKR
jgi:RHH-type rel operon transcriptional repressor/antitoxin RelB